MLHDDDDWYTQVTQYCQGSEIWKVTVDWTGILDGRDKWYKNCLENYHLEDRRNWEDNI
jgi:hypothetical protein